MNDPLQAQWMEVLEVLVEDRKSQAKILITEAAIAIITVAAVIESVAAAVLLGISYLLTHLIQKHLSHDWQITCSDIKELFKLYLSSSTCTAIWSACNLVENFRRMNLLTNFSFVSLKLIEKTHIPFIHTINRRQLPERWERARTSVEALPAAPPERPPLVRIRAQIMDRLNNIRGITNMIMNTSSVFQFHLLWKDNADRIINTWNELRDAVHNYQQDLQQDPPLARHDVQAIIRDFLARRDFTAIQIIELIELQNPIFGLMAFPALPPELFELRPPPAPLEFHLPPPRPAEARIDDQVAANLQTSTHVPQREATVQHLPSENAYSSAIGPMIPLESQPSSA